MTESDLRIAKKLFPVVRDLTASAMRQFPRTPPDIVRDIVADEVVRAVQQAFQSGPPTLKDATAAIERIQHRLRNAHQ